MKEAVALLLGSISYSLFDLDGPSRNHESQNYIACKNNEIYKSLLCQGVNHRGAVMLCLLAIINSMTATISGYPFIIGYSCSTNVYKVDAMLSRVWSWSSCLAMLFSVPHTPVNNLADLVI